MDLLQGVKEHIKNDENSENLAQNSDINMEKLLAALEKLNISEENYERLKEGILNGSVGTGGGFQGNYGGKIGKIDTIEPSYQFTLLFLLLLVIISIFVFFGYKLYKSHTDRERKREEKRRLKQQKKKK